MVGQVTRLTSANIYIEWQPALYPRHRTGNGVYPAYDVVSNHVTVLSLGGATAGTFRLAVNGYVTATITASGSLASTVIQAALEALPNVGSGGLVVSGSAGGPFTITAASALLNEFLVIEIKDDQTAGKTISQVITTQGSKWYRLDGETAEFSYSATQEATDVSALSDTARRESSTVSDATFDMTIYEAKRDYRAFIMEGVEGYLRVFEDGKSLGNRYFAWEVLIKESSSDFQQFEKIEISVSGRRQGPPIARVGSRWSGVAGL